MIVLAMDIATSTGLAVGPSNGQPRAWSVDFVRGNQERSFAEMLKLTQDVVKETMPDICVIEAPIGGKKANDKLIGLAACARGVLRLKRIDTHLVKVSSVRKHFLGKAFDTRDFPGMSIKQARSQIKGMVMKQCRNLGWRPENDDEGDALALWDYGCAQWARGYQSAPTGGLFSVNTNCK